MHSRKVVDDGRNNIKKAEAEGPLATTYLSLSETNGAV